MLFAPDIIHSQKVVSGLPDFFSVLHPVWALPNAHQIYKIIKYKYDFLMKEINYNFFRKN